MAEPAPEMIEAMWVASRVAILARLGYSESGAMEIIPADKPTAAETETLRAVAPIAYAAGMRRAAEIADKYPSYVGVLQDHVRRTNGRDIATAILSEIGEASNG